MKRIWLIGGTQESAELAAAIVQAQLPCLITVTTETARSLYPVSPLLHIRVGALQPDQMSALIAEQAICCILDASHPFAIEVSRCAIAIAEQHHLPYLRYERPAITPIDQEPESAASIITLNSLDALTAGAYLTGQRVLLTLGYRSLSAFAAWQDRAILYARLLPSVVALEAALAAGFTPDRLIALRPPVSRELERALWQQWHITTVVTKASGEAGGETVKRQVAAELGLRLIVIDRPTVLYPQQTSDQQMAITFCQMNLR